MNTTYRKVATLNEDATADDLRTWLGDLPGDARVQIEQARRWSNPTDPGGEVTITATWEGDV